MDIAMNMNMNMNIAMNMNMNMDMDMIIGMDMNMGNANMERLLSWLRGQREGAHDRGRQRFRPALGQGWCIYWSRVVYLLAKGGVYVQMSQESVHMRQGWYICTHDSRVRYLYTLVKGL